MTEDVPNLQAELLELQKAIAEQEHADPHYWDDCNWRDGKIAMCTTENCVWLRCLAYQYDHR